MRFLLFASILSFFAGPVFADSPAVANHVVRAPAVKPRPAKHNAASRTAEDKHQQHARQLINFGFGTSINLCVQVATAVSQTVVTAGGQGLAIGAGDCICVETSAGLLPTGTNVLGLVTGLSAPTTVNVYVNGIKLAPSSAVLVANSVLGSTCSTLLGNNLLTFLTTLAGLGGSCSNAFVGSAPLRAALGAQICQTNQQFLSLQTPILSTSIANSVPIFDAAAPDFSTRCCRRACNTGFVACGAQCVATGTTCVSGVPIPGRRKRRDGSGAILCPKGLTGCLVPGSRVYDCVDIKNDLESCGGCVDPANPLKPGSGTDCTALAGVDDVECVRGACQIRSCNKGFTMSSTGDACEPVAAFAGIKLNSSANGALNKRQVARPFSRT